MKCYQAKLSKNNSNLSHRKINNNNNNSNLIKQAKKTENKIERKNGFKNINYFDDNSRYNKLIQIDSLNYTNYLNKTNSHETAKNITSRNSSLLKYGFNFTNVALNALKNNSNKNENLNLKEEKQRPTSSDCNKIIKGEHYLIKETNLENYKKINLIKAKNKAANSGKDNISEKAKSRNISEGNKVLKFKENNFVFMPNVDLIIKCLKFVKFPKNYIDYYKIVLDKLQHSKNNKFLICVIEDKRHLVIFNFYFFDF